MSQGGEIWDVQALQQSLGGMSSLLTGLLHAFCRSLQDRKQEIISAHRAKDTQALYRAAHSIKGSAGQMYCKRLIVTAVALEQACLQDDWREIEQHVRIFLSEIDTTLVTMNDSTLPFKNMTQEQS